VIGWAVSVFDKDRRFGKIDATKRAYQIPNEVGTCVGWLVLLDLSFRDSSMESEYQTQLIGALQDDLLLSEYAICYDRVLSKTKVYWQLLDDITGRSDRFGIEPFQPRTKVLDLGAGTGNLSESLLREDNGRLIVAVENNRVMFNALRSKCREYLRDDDEGPGVIAAKQDVTSLYGLGDKYFDYVFLSNVLYSLESPMACLREAYRVLQPGGEIRISGPQKTTNLTKLFRRIRRDLKRQKENM
jgi:SAM-dependent methyltransferase